MNPQTYPQLILLPLQSLLNKCSIVGCYIPMMRKLETKILNKCILAHYKIHLLILICWIIIYPIYPLGWSPRFQVARYIQQVGRESNSQGFLLVLFFFYSPMKVATDHVYSGREGNPQPPALNNSPEQLEPGVNKRNT